MIIETFGDRLRRLRLRAGYRTQYQLSVVLGVHANTVSNWERQWHAPTAAMQDRLARLYGVTPHYLIYGREQDIAA